jgi:hypothetical protein
MPRDITNTIIFPNIDISTKNIEAQEEEDSSRSTSTER